MQCNLNHTNNNLAKDIEGKTFPTKDTEDKDYEDKVIAEGEAVIASDIDKICDDIDSDAKEIFCRDFDLPIKIFTKPHFKYYITQLNPYYNTFNKLQLFYQSLKQYQNITHMLGSFACITTRIINYIHNKPEYKKIAQFNLNNLLSTTQYNKRSKLYNRMNDREQFISIQLKDPEFRVLEFIDKNLVNGYTNFYKFASLFTDNEYFKICPYYQRDTLTQITTKKNTPVIKHLIGKIISSLNLTMDQLKYIRLNHIVYDPKLPNNTNTNSDNKLNDLNNELNDLDNELNDLNSELGNNELNNNNLNNNELENETIMDYESIFKYIRTLVDVPIILDAFKVEQICMSNFFINKSLISDSKSIINVPERMFFEVIKYYEKKPICEYDLTIKIDGRIAVYKNPIQF